MANEYWRRVVSLKFGVWVRNGIGIWDEVWIPAVLETRLRLDFFKNLGGDCGCFLLGWMIAISSKR